MMRENFNVFEFISREQRSLYILRFPSPAGIGLADTLPEKGILNDSSHSYLSLIS